MSLSFSCSCGATAWELPDGDANSGVHTMCYCRDCRAFARKLGAESRLAPGGGLGVFITRPDRIHVLRGADNLACLRLSPDGLERWYTTCCNSPVSSHAPGWAAMAGVTATNAQDSEALGPVRAVYCASHAMPGQGAPGRDRGIKRLMLRVLGWSIGGLLTGRSKRSPFYKDGAPLAEPQVLSREDRQALSD